MTAQEFAAIVETKCLTESGLEQARQLIRVTAKDSPYLPDHQAALAAAEARWAAEEPVRRARAALAGAGWRRSDYDPATWYNRKTKAKASLVQAIRAAGLAE